MKTANILIRSALGALILSAATSTVLADHGYRSYGGSRVIGPSCPPPVRYHSGYSRGCYVPPPPPPPVVIYRDGCYNNSYTTYNGYGSYTRRTTYCPPPQPVYRPSCTTTTYRTYYNPGYQTYRYSAPPTVGATYSWGGCSGGGTVWVNF